MSFMDKKKGITYKKYLRRRLLVFVTTFSVLISLFFSVAFTIRQYDRNLTFLKEITTSKTMAVEIWFESRRNELNNIVKIIGNQLDTQLPLDESLVKVCSERSGFFETLFISDLSGITNDCFNENHDITQREYYDQIINQGHDIAFIGPLLSKTNGQLAMVIAYKLKDENDEAKGLFGGTINISKIHDFLDSINENTFEEIAIINEDGFVISHTCDDYNKAINVDYTKQFNHDFSDEISAGKSGIISVKNPKKSNRSEIILFQEFASTPHWRVIVQYPKNKLYSEIMEIIITAWLIVGVCICILTLILRHISKKITDPLEQLSREMKEVDFDNLALDFPKGKIKEINQLTMTFNHLSFKLKQSFLKSEKFQKELSSAYEELSASNEDLEQSYQQLEKMAINLEEIFETASQINTAGLKSEEEYLDFLLNMLINIIDTAKYGSVTLFENNKWIFVSAVGHDLEQLRKIDLNQSFQVEADKVRIIQNILSNHPNMPKEKMQQIKFASKPIGHTMVSNLKIANTVVGTISLDSPPNFESFSKADTRVFEAFCNFATAFLGLKRLYNTKNAFQEKLILAMIKILEIHDPYTKGHSENVALLSSMIAKEMGFDEVQINEVYWIGLVHDIGKINIPNTILLKTGRLTEKEYEQIKHHPVWGADILSASDDLEMIVDGVLFHHERWDGAGYPNGLAGEQIPLYSRIIAVADTFDAMTSDRSYKKAVSAEESIEEILVNSAKQFDPMIVEIFCKLYEKDKDSFKNIFSKEKE